MPVPVADPAGDVMCNQFGGTPVAGSLATVAVHVHDAPVTRLVVAYEPASADTDRDDGLENE